MNFIIFFTAVILSLSCVEKSDYETLNQMENESKQNPAKNGFQYLALGDSYTIGESVNEEQRFPVQLVNRLNKNEIQTDSAIIIARTGWTTDELARGIKASKITGKFDLVTLLIGVNNQYRGRDTTEYRTQFRELLQTAIQFADSKENRVIVISIPDYGVTPFGKTNEEKIGAEIDIFNRINREESENRRVYYVDITPISRRAKSDAGLIANDGLHPSGLMYKLWVDSIFPTAQIILNN